MVELKIHYGGQPGYVEIASPKRHPLRMLTFGITRLNAGEAWSGASGKDEVALIVLAGVCDVHAGDVEARALGGRTSVFAGRASAIYIPRGVTFRVVAGASGAEVAVCRAPATADYPVHVVRPEDVMVRDVGGTGFRRYVHDVIGVRNVPAAQLIVGETYTLAGNWSSYPPHKHDEMAMPREAQQEELYFFRVRPSGGFGIQFLYTRPGSPYGALDLALPVRDDDAVIIPYGYHPVAAPPGYDLYYLWCMAGPVRDMRPANDPAHEWVLSSGDDQPDLPR